MRVLPVILIPILLAACATHPKKIDAAYVSPLKYEEYDCEQIAMEMDGVGQRLKELYKRLKSDRTSDSWRFAAVTVLFYPALLLLDGDDGPDAGEYAQLKGELEALIRSSEQKECGLSPEAILRGDDEEDNQEGSD